MLNFDCEKNAYACMCGLQVKLTFKFKIDFLFFHILIPYIS